MKKRTIFSPIWIGSMLGISLVLYGWLLFATQRTNLPVLLGCYSGLFVLYFGMLRVLTRQEGVVSVGLVLGAAVLFRILAWVAFPTLSDDCFRFVWDGRLWIHGVNPFSFTPRELLTQHADLAATCGLDGELLLKLNSPDFYTVYPAVMQGIFALSAALFPDSLTGSVLVIKFFLLMADLVNLWLLLQLMKETGQPLNKLSWYALNPLVIVELVGNAHFESLMLTGMLGAWYLLRRRRPGLAGAAFAVAIATKLTPLIFLPAFLRRLKQIDFWVFYAVTGCLSLGSFFLILNSETVDHLLSSVYLYYHNFEFNASTWYLIRETAKHFTDLNLVELVGRWLAIATFLGIMGYIALEKKPDILGFPKAVLASYLVFLLFAQAVHPWYVAPMVAWAVFTGRKYALVWTSLLPFTYLTYRTFPYQEPLWVAAAEYVILLAFFVAEEIAVRRKNSIAPPEVI